MKYAFEWDPNKAKLNCKKHKISFERAAEVFLDPSSLSFFDDEHSFEEDRWITIGKDTNGVVIVIIHTFHIQTDHGCTIRIISARKGTKKEIKQYEGESL